MDTTFSVPFLPQVGALDEARWLDAARAGEPWALEQLYQRHQGAVYALCHRLLGRTEDARDAAQTTFMRAFRQLPNFRGHSSLKTWLYRIAVNESLTQLRKRRDTAELEEYTATIGDCQPSIVERLAVQAAMAALKSEHRAVLVLFYWERLSYEEIGQVLGISLSAAKMRLHRAREEFRRRYEGAL